MCGIGSELRGIIVTMVCVLLLAATNTSADMGDLLGKLIGEDTQGGDWFGRSVATDGRTVIVGAPRADYGSRQAGAVYVFNAMTGRQEAKLRPNNATVEVGHFGESVAIEGDLTIVGAPGEDVGGAVYVLDSRRDTETVLTASDTSPNADFGSAVATDGERVLVGAWMDDQPRPNTGSAYLFNPTGRQLAKLQAGDLIHSHVFGLSVAVSGRVAIVGSDGINATGVGTGAAYLFDVFSSRQLAKLLAHDGMAQDRFGSAVAISGQTAIVGAYGDDDDGSMSGAAYLFDVATGELVLKLTANDATEGDRFGESVAIDGDLAIIGAPFAGDGVSDTGAAYVFDVTTGRQLAKLTAHDGQTLDRFGVSVAIDGDLAAVGADLDDDNGHGSGAVYLYEVPEPTSLSLLALGGVAMMRRRRGRR